MSEMTPLLKHYVKMEEYVKTASRLSLKHLENLLSEVGRMLSEYPFITSKEQLLEVEADIDKVFLKYEKKIRSTVKNSMSEVIEKEEKYCLSLLEKQSEENKKSIKKLEIEAQEAEADNEELEKKEQKSASAKTKSPKGLASAVLFMPVAGYAAYTDMLKRSTDKAKQSIDANLRFAYATKQDISSVTDKITQREDTYKRNLETDVDTVMVSAIRNTGRKIYSANKTKVRWCAVLDTHSCLVCGLYHGTIYDADSAPGIPVHERCRCILVPITSGDSEFEYNTFEDWVESLSESDKKEVLGKGRYELYSNGVTIRSFVQNSAVVPMKSLKKS